MTRWLPFLILAVGLFLAATCNQDDGGQPTSTPLAGVRPTVTPPSPTTTATPASPCPVPDRPFCDFAEEVDRALREGNTDFIVANSLTSSFTCPANMQVGPCVGLPEGTVLEGYFVGADRTNGGSYLSEDDYRSILQEAAQVDGTATDEHGPGTWRLAAVLDQSPETRVVISTTIGPDPIYEQPDSERRVFFWSAQLLDKRWRLTSLLTTVFVEEKLTGMYSQGGSLEDWLPWGNQ